MERIGLGYLELQRNGLRGTDADWIKLGRIGLEWNGSGWIGIGRIGLGLDWTGADWIGADWGQTD